MRIKRLIILILVELIIFTACGRKVHEKGFFMEESKVKVYTPAEFSSFETWFSGFDEEHIENFHYANITIYYPEFSVPGPTVYRIQGFFNIKEEYWSLYVDVKTHDNYRWKVIEPHEIPSIYNTDDYLWIYNSGWSDKHTGEKLGGEFCIDIDKRMVWFLISTR